MDSILQALVRCGMTKVEELLENDPQYEGIMDKIKDTAEKLEKKLPDVTMRDIDEVIDCYIKLSAYQDKIHYLQGLRDAGILLKLMEIVGK